MRGDDNRGRERPVIPTTPHMPLEENFLFCQTIGSGELTIKSPCDLPARAVPGLRGICRLARMLSQMVGIGTIQLVLERQRYSFTEQSSRGAKTHCDQNKTERPQSPTGQQPVTIANSISSQS